MTSHEPTELFAYTIGTLILLPPAHHEASTANPEPTLTSTASARIAVAALLDGGVRYVVVSPGSRSAPMAYALAEADAAGRVELLVRIDERSAGFTALGLALSTGRRPPC